MGPNQALKHTPLSATLASFLTLGTGLILTSSTKKKSAKKKTSAAQDSVSFEAAMQELESLVSRMEKGDQELESSLKDFERGVELTRICQKALAEAEQKVQILSKKMGQDDLQDFDYDDQD